MRNQEVMLLYGQITNIQIVPVPKQAVLETVN